MEYREDLFIGWTEKRAEAQLRDQAATGQGGRTLGHGPDADRASCCTGVWAGSGTTR